METTPAYIKLLEDSIKTNQDYLETSKTMIDSQGWWDGQHQDRMLFAMQNMADDMKHMMVVVKDLHEAVIGVHSAMAAIKNSFGEDNK